MANIKVTLEVPLIDGHPVTFKAPCDCTAVTGVKVYYPDGESTASKVFTFKDAHGNDLTGIGDLFAAGAYVKVILDTTNGWAYIQNADTNQYLENKFSDLVETLGGQITAAVSTALKVQTGSYVGTGEKNEAGASVISCDFDPKVIMFYCVEGSSASDRAWGLIPAFMYTNEYQSYAWTVGDIGMEASARGKKDGNTVYFYYSGSTGPTYHNKEGLTYHWMAIG